MVGVVAYGAGHASRDREEPQMGVRIGQWTLDVSDVEVMAQFWAAALGYRIDDDGQHLPPPPAAGADAPSVWLQPVREPTSGKNRGHPDLVPDDGNADAEVERLLALGARHADVGQSGTEGFVVLADPEGNEFCVLRGSALDADGPAQLRGGPPASQRPTRPQPPTGRPGPRSG
jgi:hypothetical protein